MATTLKMSIASMSHMVARVSLPGPFGDGERDTRLLTQPEMEECAAAVTYTDTTVIGGRQTRGRMGYQLTRRALA